MKLNSRIKTILRTALRSIAALIVGLNVYSLNASRLAGDLVPMPMGVGATVVLSGSMEPTLSTGDLLIIAKQDSYQVDDVVVFQTNRMAVVHRIVELYEKTVQGEDGEEIQQMAITQGDANITPDDPIQVSQIKGTVVFRLPIVGYLINMIKTPIGTILILALAIFLLERSFHKEREKDQDKLDAIRREIEKLKQQNGE